MRTRNILVEGIDRAGKSSLVKELKNRLSWDTRFLGHQNCNQYKRYLHEYARMEHSVLERGHISEAVYSQIFKRPDPFSFSELVVLDGVLNADFIIVYADPDVEQVAHRYSERTLAQTVDLEDILRGKQIFQKWFETHPYQNILAYRSQSWDELEALVETIASRINDDINGS